MEKKTVKKLLTFPQVDVTCCLAGETPIMLVGSEEGSDEECAELYDVLIEAGALNYNKTDELWYVLFTLECHFDKTTVALTFYLIAEFCFIVLICKIKYCEIKHVRKV